MDVILLGQMRGRSIDHGCKIRRGLHTAYQLLGFAGAGAHQHGKPGNAFDRTGTFAGQARTKPIDQQIFGFAHHRFRDVGKSEVRCKGGKLGTGCHDDGYWVV